MVMRKKNVNGEVEGNDIKDNWEGTDKKNEIEEKYMAGETEEEYMKDGTVGQDEKNESKE